MPTLTFSHSPEASLSSASGESASAGSALRQAAPGLVWSVGVLAGLGMLSLIGLALDPRELAGAPVWLKPFKFAVSGGIYAITLAVLIRPLANRRFTRFIDWGVGGILVFETVLIAIQAARGVTSHFNVSTAMDAAIFSSMGIAIAALSVLTAIAALMLARAKGVDPVLKRAAVWGLTLSLAGGSVGYLMTMPTDAQVAAMQDAPPMVVGAHTVGAEDGGPGIPITRWSRTAGDLRVPHFWGLHGLQAIPLLALGLGLLGLTTRQRRRLVHLGAMAYGSVFGILLWQALRGQPLFSPDAATLLASGAVFLITALAAALILRSR